MKGHEKRSETQVRDDELHAAYRHRYVAKYRSLVMHWASRWLRRPRRAELSPLPGVLPGQVAVSFAGHATALVRYHDLNMVCDPMLGSWAGSVRREVAPGLSPAELHDVQLILISHAHRDHLHPATLAKLPRSATVILPPRTAHKIGALSFARVVELGVGESVQYGGVDIFTAPVRHGDDVSALSYFIRGDGPSVYFCGDSGYFSGFAEVGRRFRPDIALLPIGGYAPMSFRDRHMTPLDALYAFEDLRARVMIPIHYGSFALSYERLRDPSRWLAELVRERALEQFVVELAPGESRVFVPPEAGQGARRDTSDPQSVPTQEHDAADVADDDDDDDIVVPIDCDSRLLRSA